MPSFTEPHSEKSGWVFSNREGSPGSLEVHPEVGTGIERIGYSGFKRKFLFCNLDSPSMPNTAP
jgi:hypothetical protein